MVARNLFIIAAAIVVASAQDPKIDLTIFVGGMCPYSMEFVTEQLYPTWLEMKDYMTVTVNAYGLVNATKDGDGYVFECFAGEGECLTNTQLECSKKYLPADEDYMHFINCVMGSIAPSMSAKKCTIKIGTPEAWTGINKCANSVEGQKLHFKAGQLQSKVPATPDSMFPFILINGEFSEVQQSMAMKNLKKVLCAEIDGDKMPDACNMTDKEKDCDDDA